VIWGNSQSPAAPLSVTELEAGSRKWISEWHKPFVWAKTAGEIPSTLPTAMN
jgi:hypothetical protein